MKNILISGGSGLVGKRLSKLLTARGYSVTVLTRSAARAEADNISFAHWDPEKKVIDTQALTMAEAIIHLAGANVMEKRWTKEYKEEIMRSRTDAAALLIDSLPVAHRVRSFISASAIGWYGEDDRGKKPFVETDNPANDFLGNVCREWEAAAKRSEEKNMRCVCLRTGIVLAREEGAYPQFKMPMKAGIAAILGSGRQTVSWIHVDDLCAMYIAAIENENMHGSYNAVAPQPVPNKELTVSIAEAVRGKFYLPMHVPSMLLKIAKGERATEILKSCTVSSEKIENAGFKFQFAQIDAACRDLES